MGGSEQTEHTKKEMLDALKRCGGIISEAADKVGISRTTHYKWIKEDEAYKEAVDDINEASIDFAESKLRQRMNGVMVQKELNDGPVVYEIPPDTTALIFYLKTKGKKRGYVERQEVTGADGQPMKIESKIIVNNTGSGITKDSEANV